jgi:hypothetical protein
VEECRPCPIFASFTLAFALQLRKKHGKPSVRVRKTSVIVQYFIDILVIIKLSLTRQMKITIDCGKRELF